MKVEITTKVVESIDFHACQNGEVYRRTVQIGTRTNDFYYIKSTSGMMELAPACGAFTPACDFSDNREGSPKGWRFFHCPGAKMVI